MYIYISILTSVYNYRSVHLRNINGHEQWGKGGGCIQSVLSFRTLQKRHADSSNITKRVARCSHFYLFLSSLLLELVLVSRYTRTARFYSRDKRKNGNWFV